jgi:hypothetical protein
MWTACAQAYKALRDGKPQSFDFDEATQQYTLAKASYDSIVRRHRPRIKANEAKRAFLWNSYAKKVYDTDESGKQVFVRWDFPKKWGEQSTRLYKINKELEAEIEELAEEVNRLDQARRGARAAFAENIEEELKLLAIRRDDIVAELNQREILRSQELPEVREKAQRYGVGLPAKIQALENMKEDDSSIWWMSNMIVLLFILLETSPVFVKLISKRGPYDYLLSRIEHHKKVESLRQISDMNYDLNANMQLQSRRSNGVKVNGTKREEYVGKEG